MTKAAHAQRPASGDDGPESSTTNGRTGQVRSACETNDVTEGDAIKAVQNPATVESLVRDLRSLGLQPGMTVMVHSSLSQIGYVSGGAQAVVEALLEAVGITGTIVMPTHSTDLSDPSTWSNPPVPSAWWDTVHKHMPAYDARLTPTRRMGAIVECFRHVPGLQRSAHPTVSAAAVGPNAAKLVHGHALECGLGETSPQARLYDLDGHVLLIGVTHANNTSLHLAEYRSAPSGAAETMDASPILVHGQRQWASYRNLVGDDSDFKRIGDEFGRTGQQRTGQVGAALSALMPARAAVDFATNWMATNRTWTTASHK